MTGKLVTLFPPANDQQDDGGWGEGKAMCGNCRHEWIAVSPIGALPLECPECGSVKGMWKNWFSRGFGDEEHPHWQCPCGCQFFAVTPYGIYCPNYGSAQRPYDEPQSRA